MDPSTDFGRLLVLQNLEGYRQHFMDDALWKPFIRDVCRKQGYSCDNIRPGVAGTYPTFIVDEKWVIKFFGRLFSGYDSFRIERRLGEILARQKQIPAARVLETGGFEDNAVTWYYLVFNYVDGRSIGEDSHKINFEDKLRLAQQLGRIAPLLHRIPLEDINLPGFSPGWKAYQEKLRAWFTRRLAAGETGLPELLSSQVVGYLEAFDQLSPWTHHAYLIHADLTRDHILGHFTGDRWELEALIDFGDAMPGDIFYELSALHLDAFDCDKRLLDAFLESYGLDVNDQKDFATKCMSAALQHQFDIFSPLFERFPGLHQVGSLDEMAGFLWDIKTPGIHEG